MPCGRIVLTCRVTEYREVGEKAALGGAVELEPLDDSQLKEYLKEFPGDFRNHLTTNVLPGLFPDPDVGEYAQAAVGTMSGSAANMALDRWEEYQRRREG